MAAFAYAPALLERYPTVVGGVLAASGVRNGPAADELTTAYRAEQQAVRERLGETPLASLPSLAAWRRVFNDFGVDPTRYRSAAEALLRRLTKQGEIPSLSLLVDAGNLVSIRYGLPVAILDRAAVRGAITVTFAVGDEPFRDLGGGGAVEHPEPGEVIFVDDAGAVHARRWCWRQSAESATSETTRDVLVTVEGHHEAARADVAAAVDDLHTLLARFAAPKACTTAVLTRERPVFDPPT